VDRKNIEPYFLAEEKERLMWQDGVFVFDTSALFRFYYHSKKSQDEIFSKTFEKISNRLWIPNHVEFEFLKNRERTLRKPVDEKYEKLIQEQLNAVKDYMKKAKQNLLEIESRTSKEDIHPHLDPKITQDFKERFEDFEKYFQEFQVHIDEEIKKRIEEIESFAINDTVLDAFERYFSVGREYNYDELVKIAQEGELRYKFEIPPGYQDSIGKKKKFGLQIFGDLIIWKQILEHSKEVRRPIIFITADIKKDWCYEHEGRIDRPSSLSERNIFSPTKTVLN
jgi:hypothetical protein